MSLLDKHCVFLDLWRLIVCSSGNYYGATTSSSTGSCPPRLDFADQVVTAFKSPSHRRVQHTPARARGPAKARATRRRRGAARPAVRGEDRADCRRRPGMQQHQS